MFVIELVLNFMLIFNLCKSDACEVVAYRWHRRKAKVLEVVNAWMANRVLLWSPSRPIGTASPSYKRVDFDIIDGPHQLLVTNYMNEQHSNGQVVTARHLQLYLLDHCSIDISQRRICDYLRKWGCTWARSVEVTPVDKDWHEKRVARFIVGYARALRLQAEGMYVIVYMDESYIHNNHAKQMSWFLPDSNRHVKRAKRAGRLVIFHAITKDGLLFTQRSAADGDLSKQTVNAEYIYQIDTRKAKAPAESASNSTDTKDDKDSYHGNIDGAMFLTWLNNRLIPAFLAKFPGRKMILVMDNASYHNSHEDGWVSAGNMRKEQLVAAFRQYSITTFTAQRERKTGQGDEKVTELVTFDEASFSKNKKTEESADCPVPYVDEMKKHLSGWLRQHPEVVITPTRRIMQERGWEILFTPPLEPRCQPIEQLWGQVKNNVADQYVVGRGIEVTREQLLAAFYEHCYRGKIPPHEALEPGVTPRHCRGMITNSEQWMQLFIEEHPALLGGKLSDDSFSFNKIVATAETVEQQCLEDAQDALMMDVDREARLEEEEDRQAAEWEAARGIAQLNADWRCLGPGDEAEEEHETPPPPPRAPRVAAPALLVDAVASSHLRRAVLAPTRLNFR